MADDARRTDLAANDVYGVRPEPPHFDELLRSPDPSGNETMPRPAGAIRRGFGAQRARFLFRVGLAAALGLVVVAAFAR